MTKKEIARDAKQEGEQRGESKRDNLYAELLKRLVPLGRINDLIAAATDKAKLTSLAHEFGLEI